MEEDRRRAAMQKADTEYLAREIASLRIALGEVATRDFLRSELARLAEELDEAGAAPAATGAPAAGAGQPAGASASRRPTDGVGLDEPPRRPGRRLRPGRPAGTATGPSTGADEPTDAVIDSLTPPRRSGGSGCPAT